MANAPISVEICMGSSCFVRGNSQALKYLETYIREQDLQDRCRLKGRLCVNECSSGPVLIIDGQRYQGVHPECAVDLLKTHLGEAE